LPDIYEYGSEIKTIPVLDRFAVCQLPLSVLLIASAAPLSSDACSSILAIFESIETSQPDLWRK
jgi:hypothetical protein